MYTVLPIKWEVTIYTVRGSPLPSLLLPVPPLFPPSSLLPLGALQIHDLYWGSHSRHINSTHSLIPPHGGRDQHCYHGLYQWYRSHTSLRNIHGDRGLPLRGFPSCQALSYLPESQGASLWVSTLTSFIIGTSSGEPSDEADMETSPRSCHSSSKRHRVLLHCLELQLQCRWGSPGW